MSVLPRLRRLFGADGRCFDVAVDHGFFGEPRFLAGWLPECPRKAIRRGSLPLPGWCAAGRRLHHSSLTDHWRPS